MVFYLSTQLILLFFIVFFLANHPMLMNFMITLISVLLGFNIYLAASCPWFTYILIMIFLSGMMVMLIYMSSLISNEMFKTKMDTSAIFMIFLFGLNMIMIQNIFYTNTSAMNSGTYMKSSNSLMTVFKTYNSLAAEVSSFLIVYLLLVLIVAVKITANKNLPLRSK